MFTAKTVCSNLAKIRNKEVCNLLKRTSAAAAASPASHDEIQYDPTFPRADRVTKWLSADQAIRNIFKSGWAAVTNYPIILEAISSKDHLKSQDVLSTPSAEKWLRLVKFHQFFIFADVNVFVHGIAATPTPLLDSLCATALQQNWKNIILWHLHLEGNAEWIKPEFEGIVKSNSMFTGANLRKAVASGHADALSIFLSEIPWLFRRKIVNLDVALIHVSPPDKHGFCSLGTSVDATRAAILNAKHIIALANPHMPRTIGDGIIHSSHIDTMVFYDGQLHERHTKPGSDIEKGIGTKIAEELVEDGATLQMGIGAIPDAALAALTNHQRLGIHTEMFSDGVLDLVNCGAVNNAHKYVHPGKIVTSFVYGSTRLYEFLHDNPQIYMGDITWVNDPAVIRKNPKVTAINSAVEVDITGQIVSDSIGTRIISGFGGQVDFIRGASFCNDGKGKPIIALPSVTKNGESKIVPYIKDGAGVVTTRAHTRYVVTEYGIANLFGKSMRQRAYELIRIAHPDHRESLEQAAFNRLKCMPSAD